MEQLNLLEVPKSPRRTADEKALKVAHFNLMAYGDWKKAVEAIEADIGRDERMYERVMKDYRTTLRLRGFGENEKLACEPKPPKYAIKIKREAIEWLTIHQPTPEKLWPKERVQRKNG